MRTAIHTLAHPPPGQRSNDVRRYRVGDMLRVWLERDDAPAEYLWGEATTAGTTPQVRLLSTPTKGPLEWGATVSTNISTDDWRNKDLVIVSKTKRVHAR